MKFKIGDRVRVRGQREQATVATIYAYTVNGQCVRLDRIIDGFYSWNAKNLVKVRAKAARGRE